MTVGEEDIVSLRPCGHDEFHPSCIEQALASTNGRCPLCRQPAEIQWEINGILGHRHSEDKGSRVYQIGWKGSQERSWVVREELVPYARRLLNRYERTVMMVIDLTEPQRVDLAME